MRKDTMKQ